MIPQAHPAPPRDLPGWEIVCGDALDVLSRLRSGVAHCCVTSPPYWNLRDYRAGGQIGREATLGEYVANLVRIFREVRRVLRDDGVLWLNVGDCYARDPKKGVKFAAGETTYFRNRQAEEGNVGVEPPVAPKNLVGVPWRLAFALQDDGWILRCDTPWVKFNGSPAPVTDRLTFTHEYLFMFSKSPTYYYDVDAARKAAKSKPHAPGNKSRGGRLAQQNWNQGVSTDPADDPDRVWASNGTRQRRTTDAWRESLDAQVAYLTQVRDGGGMLVDDDGHVAGVLAATAQSKIPHFATYPERLVEPLIALSTSERGVCSACGAPWVRIVERTNMVVVPSERREMAHAVGAGSGRTVLSGTMVAAATTTTTGWRQTCPCDAPLGHPFVIDPFCGSGTTGVVAVRRGCEFIGVDVNPDYCEMAQRRVGGVL